MMNSYTQITDKEVPGLSSRHDSTQRKASYFANGHLDPDLAEIARLFTGLAVDLLNRLPDGPELTNGLHDLVRSKDCCVRHALDVREGSE